MKDLLQTVRVKRIFRQGSGISQSTQRFHVFFGGAHIVKAPNETRMRRSAKCDTTKFIIKKSPRSSFMLKVHDENPWHAAGFIIATHPATLRILRLRVVLCTFTLVLLLHRKRTTGTRSSPKYEKGISSSKTIFEMFQPSTFQESILKMSIHSYCFTISNEPTNS